jgi:hypothetical protein
VDLQRAVFVQNRMTCRQAAVRGWFQSVRSKFLAVLSRTPQCSSKSLGEFRGGAPRRGRASSGKLIEPTLALLGGEIEAEETTKGGLE